MLTNVINHAGGAHTAAPAPSAPSVAQDSTPAPTPESTPESTGQRDEPSRADFLNRFNQIAEKERQLHEREQQLKSKFGTLENDLKIVERLKNAKSAKEKLEIIGGNYADLTREMLTANPNDDRVAELQKRLEEIEGTAKEAHSTLQQQNFERIESQAKSEIKELVANSPEYNIVKALGEIDTVWELCTSYYQRTGQVLTYSDAAKLVEEDLRSKLSSLREHNSAPWLQELLGLQKREEPPAQNVTNARPVEGYREQTLVHRLLNDSAPQRTTSLGALSSSSSDATGNGNSQYKTDEQARQESLDFLRKLRQG
jgi:hypothetical protein